MTDRIKFTVWRDRWLRGEGSLKSRLLRPADGRQCCIGFLSEACGVPRESIFDKSAACELATIARLPEWTLGAVGEIGSIGHIYLNNDAPNITDQERELRLTKLFAAQGVDVTFADGTGEP